MSQIARWMARRLWFAMLWSMRRTWMRKIQRASVQWFPESRRQRAIQTMQSQNRLARRLGLPMLTVALNLFMASVVLTIVFHAALYLLDNGVLSMSDDLRARISEKL